MNEKPLRVAITGASGLLGSALSRHLTARGDQVFHLVRGAPATRAEIAWAPGKPLAPDALAEVDAVVHLAGAGIADRPWTPNRMRAIRQSRTLGTTVIAEAVARAEHPVRLVSGSAIGIYGDDRGDEVLTETSPTGQGFLADVCRDWESATSPAVAAGRPVAMIRTGIVLTREGGALGRMLPLSRLGFGKLGSGRQYWAWISLVDHIAATTWLLDHPEITGPVNLTAPEPARQSDFAAAVGREIGMPALIPAPAFGVRAVLWGMASELLGSRRVVPRALEDSGFEFARPTLPAAVATALAD